MLCAAELPALAPAPSPASAAAAEDALLRADLDSETDSLAGDSVVGEVSGRGRGMVGDEVRMLRGSCAVTVFLSSDWGLEGVGGWGVGFTVWVKDIDR